MPLPRRLAYEFGLSINSAVLVNEVYPGSPASKAGLASGDIIVSFGEHNTGGIDELHRLLTAEAANQSIPLVILLGVEKRVLTIVALHKEG
jgi:S1-C subfamily serine protease